jgi:hypothetical protein
LIKRALKINYNMSNSKGEIIIGTAHFITRTLIGSKKNDTHVTINGKVYELIPVISKSDSKYSALSPFHLKDQFGRYVENVWQFSKVYHIAPETKCKGWYSKAHTQIIDNNVTKDYVDWRTKGMLHDQPVRRPVPKETMKICIASLSDCCFDRCVDDKDFNKNMLINMHGKVEVLNYIDARKKIYIPLYERCVRKHELYKELLDKLNNGINLCIVDFDGPKKKHLQYYIEKYNAENDWIKANTIKLDKKNYDIMLNDDKAPFGHGYVLGGALLTDLSIW